MAKTSYLNLTNKILRRINEDTISDVTAAIGKSLIVTNLINEAQVTLYTEGINWYSLYATETISTVASTTEYALPTSHGRTLLLINETSNLVLKEDFIKYLDQIDPDRSATSTPTHFTIQGSNYRLYPIPSGVETLRTRYYKQPTALTANADTSDLPLECENAIIHWAWYEMLEYMKEYEGADRTRLRYEALLKKAKIANDKILDRMDKFNPNFTSIGIAPPSFPSNYPRTY